jgi:hypothetical protein
VLSNLIIYLFNFLDSLFIYFFIVYCSIFNLLSIFYIFYFILFSPHLFVFASVANVLVMFPSIQLYERVTNAKSHESWGKGDIVLGAIGEEFFVLGVAYTTCNRHYHLLIRPKIVKRNSKKAAFYGDISGTYRKSERQTTDEEKNVIETALSAWMKNELERFGYEDNVVEVVEKKEIGSKSTTKNSHKKETAVKKERAQKKSQPKLKKEKVSRTHARSHHSSEDYLESEEEDGDDESADESEDDKPVDKRVKRGRNELALQSNPEPILQPPDATDELFALLHDSNQARYEENKRMLNTMQSCYKKMKK